MGRGIFAGIGLGALVSLGLAVLVTFLVPAHRPEAMAVDTPQTEVAEPGTDGAEAPVQSASVGSDASTDETAGTASTAAPATHSSEAEGTQAVVAEDAAQSGASDETGEGSSGATAMTDNTATPQPSGADGAETAQDVGAGGSGEQSAARTQTATDDTASPTGAASVPPSVGGAEDLAEQPAQSAQTAATQPAPEAPVTTPRPAAIAQPADETPQTAQTRQDAPKPVVGEASGPQTPQTGTAAQSVVVAALDDAPQTPSVQKPQQPAQAEDETSEIESVAETPKPEVGAAAELADSTAPEAVAVAGGRSTEPVLPNPQALAPMEPQEEPAIAVDAVSPPAPAATQTQSDTGAETETQSPAPVRIVPNGESGSTGLTSKRAGSIVDRAARSSAIRVNRPTDAQTAEEAPVEAAQTAPETDDAAPATGGTPIAQFAQPFADPEGKPLMSIVLMDNGVDLAADEIGLPALRSFPYPVSFAVDYSLPDAAERMEKYRSEGFEVLALVDLPKGAQATDVEVTMSVALDRMNSVVGVLGGTDTGLQETREAADQVTAVLAATGHGLVTQPQGLNTMPKLARKLGVPAAPVFRDFDGSGQDARVIRRFLDQAAFKARQEGGVIMLGRLRSETIKALLVWGLADRASQVALAPVSAVLSASQE